MGVWVILVYIGCAFLTPILLKINRLAHRHRVIVVAVFYILYEVICYDENNYLFRSIFLIMGFSFPYLAGISIKKLSEKFILRFTLLNGVIYIAIALQQYWLNSVYILTSEFKYRPKIYYLSYAFW